MQGRSAGDDYRAWGCETVVLQSSAMGYAVYEAMGFRTVVRYAIYARR